MQDMDGRDKPGRATALANFSSELPDFGRFSGGGATPPAAAIEFERSDFQRKGPACAEAPSPDLGNQSV
jgi:hypothetical protein